MPFPAVILHNKKTDAIRRFHPWVFSGAIKSKEGNLHEGDVVEVYSDRGEYLGSGHYGTGSIAVRIFSFEKTPDLQQLWRKKLENALQVRKTAGLAENSATNAYRLINAEGDGLPGLIIDWYNGTAVIQAHSKGMHKERETFTEALKELYKAKLQAVYDKSSSSLNIKNEGAAEKGEKQNTTNVHDGYLLGETSEKIILENHHQFLVDWVHGQKTGFFIDQRDNRRLLADYSHGKKVLNTFCYSGGFSVYAAKAGARKVDSVDSSAKAIEWTNENIKLNKPASTEFQSYVSDVFDFLKNADNDYDVIILDPPAFAKGLSARHAAITAYGRLNLLAFKKIKPGGIVFAFSCSQVISQGLFTGAVTAAAIESGRKIRILHHLTQPADHPVSIYHPEGLYLKGLVLAVD